MGAASVERARGNAIRGAGLCAAALLSVSAAAIEAAGALAAAGPPTLVAALAMLVAAGQGLAAASALVRPTRAALLWGLATNLFAFALWRAAQTVGLPSLEGVWRSEIVGVADLYGQAASLAAAFAFLLQLLKRARSAWLRIARHVLAILAPTVFLVWAVYQVRLAQVLATGLVLQGEPSSSLRWLFLPVGLLLLGVSGAGYVRRGWPERARLRWQGLLGLQPLVLVLSLLVWGGCVAGREAAWLSPSSPITAPAGAMTTLAYCWPGGRPLAMAVSAPHGGEGPAPVVVYIHGGETPTGIRGLEEGSVDAPFFETLRSELLARGFVVAAIDYRLAPLNHVADEVRDARCAVRFLKTHAATLGIDPARVGVLGPSQGGYISAMLGLASPDEVQAVVDMWGPADLSDFSGSLNWGAALSGAGAESPADMRARLRAASPLLFHVGAHAPPFLIIQGLDDGGLALHHARDLYRRLKAAGADATYVPARTEAPTPDALVRDIGDFFSRTLGGRQGPAEPGPRPI
jgi:acetyl esterase/lipase